MSNLIPISTYNLALKPFNPSAALTEEYPVTIRITLAAVDPEPVDDKKEPSTLRILKRNTPFFDDSEEEEDSEDELDDESEEESEEEEKPKKSNKNKKASKAEDVDIEDSDDEELDEDEDVSEFVICTLAPNVQFQQSIDLTITPDEQVYFVVTGSYPIHLVGNYVEHPADEDSEDSEDYDEDDEEDDEYNLTPDEDEVYGAPQYDLEDLEDESDIENKIEELVEDEQNSKKRSSPSEEKPESKKSKKANKQAKEDKKQVQFTKELEQGPTGSTLINDKEVAKEEPTKSKKQLKKERQQQQKKEAEEALAADKAEKAAKSDKPEEKKFPTKTLLGGVITEDRKLGKGSAAKSGNKVGIRYIGKLKNGKVFDKNTSGKPFVFGLGKGECIKGFDLGVAGMAVGGERRVVIPPKMGYGNQALPGLPANSELTFDIKLVSLK